MVVESNNTKKDNNSWVLLQNLLNNSEPPEIDINAFRKLYREGFFCGPPDEKYIQIVIQAKEGIDLFTLNSLSVLCKIEQAFIQMNHYEELCILTSRSKRCCRPWSLGNYIALLMNKSSCLAITVRFSPLI